MELFQELQNLIKELDVSVKSLRKTGEDFARSEMEYKVKIREEVLRMRDDGLAVGLINLTVYGIPDVARLRFSRDCKQAIFLANQESVNAIKLKIKIVNEQLAREYNG